MSSENALGLPLATDRFRRRAHERSRSADLPMGGDALAGAVTARRLPLQRFELSNAIEVGEQKIAQLMRGSTFTLGADEVLIKAGQDEEFAYRLQSGWAWRTRALEQGREQGILIYLPGDLFAVQSLFVRRHDDEIRIISSATLERIHRRDLYLHYARDTDIAHRCMWQLVEEERRVQNQLVSLGQGSALQRLAATLLDLCQRLAASNGNTADIETFDLPMTQLQLAKFLGITPVHVNRVLRALRKANVFALRRGVATVLDRKQLMQFAQPFLDACERWSAEP